MSQAADFGKQAPNQVAAQRERYRHGPEHLDVRIPGCVCLVHLRRW